MKKIVLSIILLFFLNFIPKISYGQEISDNIPGFSCGVANDVSGKDKCCNTLPSFDGCTGAAQSTISSGASSVLHFIDPIVPIVGWIADKIDDGIDKCEKVKAYIDSNLNTEACITGKPMIGGQLTTNFSSSGCKCIDTETTNPNKAMIDMCAKYLTNSINTNELKNCFNCASSDGMWTGMGCLPLDLNRLIGSFVLSTGIGIGGLFALLCIIYSAFMMQSSQGNPEKLKKAQEMITSCIMGLMLIIFSVLIMKIIGVNILKIPGFGG